MIMSHCMIKNCPCKIKLNTMTRPISVLVSYPSSFGGGPRETFGNSGFLISERWVLTHGSLINPMMMKDVRIRNLVLTLKMDEFIGIPKEISQELNFRVMWESSRENEGKRRHMEEKKGFTVIVWKCSLLNETFASLFAYWSFDKITKTDRCLLPVFLMISLNYPQKNNPIVSARKALKCIIEQDLAYPVRGLITEIESTPFGNPVFMNSVARGVVSNIVGKDGCIILTDANSVPGCEGGPLYVIDKRGERRLCGMVIAPISWCRGEWVDYTFVADLNSCLQQVLNRVQMSQSLKLLNPRKGAEIGDSKIADLLDRCVLTIKCGSSWGTGILVEVESGTILTCSHVVREASESGIKVMLQRYDDQKHIPPAWAKLIYRTPDDKPYDVAVLRVNPKEVEPSLKAIHIQGVLAHRGEAVATAGFPFFSSSLPTISRGNVSRSLPCMLQTTCCIQSGASGGPVIQWSTGEMLGMIVCNAISSSNSALYPRLNMAIPASVLKGPLETYLKTNDAKVLETLTSQDAIVHQTWDLYLKPRSKI